MFIFTKLLGALYSTSVAINIQMTFVVVYIKNLTKSRSPFFPEHASPCGGIEKVGFFW
jgi:hypothetical protein